MMARRVSIELSSDEDIRLRGSLLDIQEGVENLFVLDGESPEETLNRMNVIRENLSMAVDEITGILDY